MKYIQSYFLPFHIVQFNFCFYKHHTFLLSFSSVLIDFLMVHVALGVGLWSQVMSEEASFLAFASVCYLIFQ